MKESIITLIPFNSDDVEISACVCVCVFWYDENLDSYILESVLVCR